MSARILAFPGRPQLRPMADLGLCAPVDGRTMGAGDLMVCCLNSEVGDGRGLWCAFPVAVVDDDGVVLGVTTPTGRMIGADRVSCRPQVYGFRAADHDAGPFAAMAFRTWMDVGPVLVDFALIGARRTLDGASADDGVSPAS